MSDNGSKKTFVNQYRRKTLVSGIALLAVYVSAPASFASGGGGGGGECGSCESEEPSSGAKKKPKTKEEKQATVPTMSQAKFLRLSPAEITEQITPRPGHKISKIEGFDYWASKDQWLMAYHSHRSSRRLVKDMAKLKTEKTRIKRLDEEIRRTKKLIELTKKERKDLKENDPKRTGKEKTNKFFKKLFNKDNGSASEVQIRIDHLTNYLRDVERWSRVPMQGTLK